VISFLIFLVAAKVVIPNRTIIPFFFPLPAFALLLVSLFNFEISIFFTIILSILVTYGVTTSPDLLVFYLITSFVGALTLGNGKNIARFIWAAISIAVVGIFIVVSYRLTNPYTDMVGILTLSGTILLNGFASASIAISASIFIITIIGTLDPTSSN